MKESEQKLVQDLKAVLGGAEELIKLTAGQSTDAARQNRARLAGAVLIARDSCHRFEHRRAAARFWTNQVRWAALLAAGGYLIWLAFGRGRKNEP